MFDYIPYYGSQAYRFKPAPEEQITQYKANYTLPKQQQRYRSKLTILSLKNQVKNMIPREALIAKTPQMLRSEELQPLQQPPESKNLYHLWNEKAIFFGYPSRLHKLLTLFMSAPLLLWIVYLTKTAFDNPTELMQPIFGIPVVLFSLGFAIGWFAIFWLFRKTLPHQGLKSIYEFNRQTGMIRHSQFIGFSSSEKQIKAEIPFSEVDALIYPKSQKGYCLILQHQKSALSIQFPVFTLKSDPVYLWYFIQNYMDINQPLPDIPIFEKYRAKDPVTAQYDKDLLRNTRHWVDMSPHQWKKEPDRILFDMISIMRENKHLFP